MVVSTNPDTDMQSHQEWRPEETDDDPIRTDSKVMSTEAPEINQAKIIDINFPIVFRVTLADASSDGGPEKVRPCIL